MPNGDDPHREYLEAITRRYLRLLEDDELKTSFERALAAELVFLGYLHQLGQENIRSEVREGFPVEAGDTWSEFARRLFGGDDESGDPEEEDDGFWNDLIDDLRSNLKQLATGLLPLAGLRRSGPESGAGISDREGGLEKFLNRNR